VVNSTGRDSSVGIVTRYGLYDPMIETLRGRDFYAPVQTGPVTNPNSYTTRTAFFFPGVKRPGRGVDHLPHLYGEVKKRVELYISTPLSVSAWQVRGRNLPFNFLLCIIYVQSKCQDD
jgi:hypothetical protein